ncbi:short chain dehydrogenase [Mycobacteroides abscessus subsp. bolletii]|uniref:SDR family oxidoreductase n=1 Tax=Mycobacteroides abscessus TaxID=36809 RepID=UPI0009A60BAA|nr:NAD(P)-dependent oxidoreductase [Mycobacteroides abscessus]SKG75203.1 short chain dehydrogenase [Mycobacteroides abscessus subsp. bolletii]SKH25961.1 short chain dehydrogenase [Mycobacteroides abscessus subsp. bolletii]
MADALTGLTAFISGGSRGIGLEIAKKLVGAGVNVSLIAKTDKPNDKLAGTIHSAAAELRAVGGGAVLPIVGDIRDEDRVTQAVQQTADTFGGIDICINNASALNLAEIGSLPMKRFDLLQSVNVRGTYVVTQACLPHLRGSSHARVLTLSPPLNLDPVWFAPSAYTVSKYGMTIVTLGVAESERRHGIAANCLWPLTTIATAAVQNLLGGNDSVAQSRTPQIVADAALALLREPTSYTGNATIVEDVLADTGISDLSEYSHVPGQTVFLPDFFIDPQRVSRNQNTLVELGGTGWPLPRLDAAGTTEA